MSATEQQVLEDVDTEKPRKRYKVIWVKCSDCYRAQSTDRMASSHGPHGQRYNAAGADLRDTIFDNMLDKPADEGNHGATERP